MVYLEVYLLSGVLRPAVRSTWLPVQLGTGLAFAWGRTAWAIHDHIRFSFVPNKEPTIAVLV